MALAKFIVKYIKQLSVSVLAVFCLIACNDEFDNEVSGASERIIVRTEIASQTRAGYEGTTVLPSEFIMDINQSNKIYNYSLVKMIKQNESNIYTPSDGINLLWADENRSDVTIKAMTIPYGLSIVDIENPMAISVCPDQKTAENVIKSDLLGATSDNGIIIEGRVQVL